jgi:hypothetical protein
MAGEAGRTNHWHGASSGCEDVDGWRWRTSDRSGRNRRSTVRADLRRLNACRTVEGSSVSESPPDLVAIDHDDYHAKHVGRTADGRRFFLTNPFEPASAVGGSDGGEYVALYVFDAAGKLLEARIDAFGPRATVNEEERRRVYQQRLRELGDVVFERIEVVPFAVERFGVTFGLVPGQPEDDDDPWAVEAMPGNYMAFFEPWDSGDYDT